MEIVQKILAPTDLLPFSAKGVRCACNLAKALQVQVIIAHVFKTEEYLSAARDVEVASTRTETENLLVRLQERQERLLQ